MSDLVERLELMTSTHERHEFGVGDFWNVCEEAADEIERLRAENATLRQALKNHAEEAAKMMRIPEGWVMVPNEPITGANYNAGLWSRRNWDAALEDMIAAAPKPEK